MVQHGHQGEHVTLNNICILSADLSDVSAWLNENKPIHQLPDSRDVACMWLTLCDKTVVTAKTLRQGNLARVVILHQSGCRTPPSVIQPVIEQFRALSCVDKPVMYLILTGNSSFMGHQDWVRYLSLHTPGLPTVGGLLFSLCVRSLFQEGGFVARVLRFLMRRG